MDPRKRVELALARARIPGDTAMFQPQIQSALSDINRDYPAIGRVQKDWGIGYNAIPSEQQQGTFLEFYPKGEDYSPKPENVYQEIYPRTMLGNEFPLKTALAGDALHWFGGSGYFGIPNDPAYMQLKEEMRGSLTPEQLAYDKKAHGQAVLSGDTRSFNDWMNQSRLDAYIRGNLFPDKNDDWNRGGTYTDKQKEILKKIKSYLTDSQPALKRKK